MVRERLAVLNIALISAFRNSTAYIQRYCEQMDSLQVELAKQGVALKLILGYGDSSDRTGEFLHEQCTFRFDCSLVDVSHGGPAFGSVVHVQRFKQLAYVMNSLWSNLPCNADVVGLVESDLVWSPESLLGLLEGLHGAQMIAPMVYDLKGAFYDSWAYRRHSKHFTNEPPYHPDLKGTAPLEMDSVGSVFLLDGKLGRQVFWPEEDVVVGLCKQVRELSGRIVLMPNLKVYHP